MLSDFSKTLGRIPGHSAYPPERFRTHGFYPRFPRRSILKTLLRVSSAPSASSLPVSWWSSSTLSCWKISLPLLSIILN